MSYKAKVKIVNFDGETEIVNIETVGQKIWGGYRRYFDCFYCDNQSICDDSGTLYDCNNYSDFTDPTDEKLYCRNYERK